MENVFNARSFIKDFSSKHPYEVDNNKLISQMRKQRLREDDIPAPTARKRENWPLNPIPPRLQSALFPGHRTGTENYKTYESQSLRLNKWIANYNFRFCRENDL